MQSGQCDRLNRRVSPNRPRAAEYASDHSSESRQLYTHAGATCGRKGFRCCGSDDGDTPECNEESICAGAVCAACGRRGELCCGGGKCEATASCNEDGVCELSCGAEGLPCCTPDTSSASESNQECPRLVSLRLGISLTCVGGVCTECGGVTQPCCDQESARSICNTGGACDNATLTCRADPANSEGAEPPIPKAPSSPNGMPCTAHSML